MSDRIASLKAALEAREFFPMVVEEICSHAAAHGSLKGWLTMNRFTVSGSLAYDSDDEAALYAAFGE